MRGGNKEGQALGLSKYNCSSAPGQFRGCLYSGQELRLLMSGEHRAQGSGSEERRAKQAAGCQRSTQVHLVTNTSPGPTRGHAEVRMTRGQSVKLAGAPRQQAREQ